ncbi:MAG: hypothetical protein JO058_23895 [Alphaproteobacteria bacterium]|nr:hypothetical protein [Alphaproteobacteria bacterium]
MRIIEVRSGRVEFPEILAAMREWLDRHERPLVRFETRTDGDLITMKIHLNSDDLAELFRQSFHGAYAGPVEVPPVAVPATPQPDATLPS